MSARSRYLAAISPRNEADETSSSPNVAAKSTSPSNFNFSGGAQKAGSGLENVSQSPNISRNVVSPSNVMMRGGRSGIANRGASGSIHSSTGSNIGNSGFRGESSGQAGDSSAGANAKNASSHSGSTPFKGLAANHAFYGAPPPPPPPGPPPKKNKKRAAAVATSSNNANTHSASGAGSHEANKPPISSTSIGARKLQHPQPPWSQQQQQQQLSNNSYRTETIQNDSKNDGNGSPSKSTRGEQWSPREEIQPGNVAKFKQMLWGGGNEAGSGGNSTTKDHGDNAINVVDKARSPSKLSHSPNNRGAIGGDTSVSSQLRQQMEPREDGQQQQQNESSSSQLNRQLNQTSQLQQSHQQQQDSYPRGMQRAPPSTPPRPQGPSSKNHSWITSPSSAARGSSIRNSSPPKYKMKAPPPLDRAATPSLVYNSLEDQNEIEGNGTDSAEAKGRMTTPQRNQNEQPSHPHSQSHHHQQHQHRNYTTQSHQQPLGTPPRSSVAPPSRLLSNQRWSPNSKSNESHTNATNPTTRPSPLRQRLGNLTPLDTSFDDPTTPAFEIKYTPTPTAASKTHHPDMFDRNHHTATEDQSVPQPPSPSASGIQTLTAFKRPNHKVGIIFTRQSREHPDVAVISQIFPDSIFASHARNYYLANKVPLEGAEVIAVNGVPVRDPRHGAELVAKAVEEVRLTVKRGDIVSDEDEYDFEEEDSGAGTKELNEDVLQEKHHDLEHDVNGDIDATEELMPSRESPENDELMPETTDELSRPLSRANDSNFVSPRRGPVDLDDSVDHSDFEMSVATEAAGAAASEPTSVKTKPQSSQTPKNKAWSLDSKSRKSHDIVEKRRQIAQAMLMSADMVEDPIKNSPEEELFVGVSNSDDWDANQDWDKNRTFDNDDSDQSIHHEEFVDDAQTDAPVVEETIEAAPKHAQSQQQKPKSMISPAEKRRIAALQMYNSEDMVADNVDDFRLGTIDAISPNAKNKISMGIPGFHDSTRQPSGSSDVSVTNMTDITTNSATTAKMGPTPRHQDHHKENELDFGDIKSAEEVSIGVGSGTSGEASTIQGSSKASDQRPDATNVSAPTANHALPSSSNNGASQTAQIKAVKTDDDNSSVAASSVAISDHSGDSRSGRSFFGSKKKRTIVGANDGQPPNESKKKKSLFGVAKLIRKASSKKGKSAKKGKQEEDFNLFVKETTSSLSAKSSASTSEVKSNTAAQPKLEIAPATAVLPSKPSPEKISPSPVKEEAPQVYDESDTDFFKAINKDELAPFEEDLEQKQEPNDTSFFDAAKPADFSTWEDDSFFNLKSPFKSSKENTNTSAFGFPEVDVAKTADVFDAWGEPSTIIPAPTFDSKDQFDQGGLDFHPKDAEDHFGRKKDVPFDNGDTMSYDGTEMSEVTNPTFASTAIAVRTDQDGDDGSKHNNHVKKVGSGGNAASLSVTGTSRPNRASSPGSSSNEPSESAIPLLADSDLSKKSPGSSGSVASNRVQQTENSKCALVKPDQRRNFNGDVRDRFHEKENYSSKHDNSVRKLPLHKYMVQKTVGIEVHADDPPLSMSLEAMESSGDEKEDIEVERVKAIDSDDSYTNNIAVKSRILSKYAKSGKNRKQNRPGISDSIPQAPDRLTNDIHDEELELSSKVPRQLPKVHSKPLSKYNQDMDTTPVRTNESNKRNNLNIKNQTHHTEPKIQDRAASQCVTDPLKNIPSVTQGSRDQPAPSRYRRRPDLMVKQEPSNSTHVVNQNLQSVSPGPRSSQPYRRKGGRSSPRALDTAASNSFSPDNQTTKALSKNRYSYSTKKKSTPSFVDDPNYYSMEHRLMQIKDPIQRAGVRLLWAAAIPIQTQARRYLARQLAIKKMCAVLTVQSFIRRWRAERDLEIALWSAIQIQAAWRGWFARDSLEDNHYCATQIQRVVRGYLATMHVFEDLYSITIVQSVVRMHFAINKAVDRLSSIIVIQAWYRGVRCRCECREREYSAIAIQSNWRRYMSQMSYQFDIIDIIIVQSIVRRRKAILMRKGLCATKIQAAWRSYDCSMAYVHTLADVITVQSVVRRWLTLRKLAAIRIQCAMRVFLAKKQFAKDKALYILVTRHASATKIQSVWRSYCAQVQMLVSIVNIIIIQSLWRKRKIYSKYGPYLKRIRLARERKKARAATKIQAIWRGFVACTTFIIFKYETQASITIQKYWRRYLQATNYSLIYLDIVKIQAVVRGHQERSWQNFRSDCATIIQAACRRFLVRKECHNECMISILISAAATSLRMRNSVTKIQRWWYQEMLTRRQKQAALIIERFFIYVKKEVEKEVKALKKKKKERRLRRKMRQSDEWILERAWLNTVEETSVVPEGASLSYHNDYTNIDPGIGQRIYTKHDRYSTEPEPSINDVIEEDAQSEVSGLTDLSFGNRHLMGHQARKIRKTKREIEEESSLDEAFLDTEARHKGEKLGVYEGRSRRNERQNHSSKHSSRIRTAQYGRYPSRR